MYEKTDKRRIYQLINMYLAKRIDEEVFCSDFVPSYDLELDYETLSEEEYKAFDELSIVASRYSGFEEDHRDYPGTYFTKEELMQKVMETKLKLK
ncbi:MAG: hypothetical protein P0S96_01190 [Simkaniaceae bacterium]|nr:hypothetical protein [Candidatus Sacchlamyda saccharinae]